MIVKKRSELVSIATHTVEFGSLRFVRSTNGV